MLLTTPPIPFLHKHRSTIADAVTKMQALSNRQKKEKLEAPGAKEEVGQKVGHQAGEKPVYALSEAISEYRRHRDPLGAKDPKTVKRENSGLNFWEDKYGKEELGKVNDALLKEFAEWRKGMGVSWRHIYWPCMNAATPPLILCFPRSERTVPF